MKHFFKYLPELILLSFQLTPFAFLGTIVASFYIFLIIAFSRKLDVLSLFLILLPSIALRQNDFFFQVGQNQFGETSWIQIFVPTLESAIIISFLTVSPHFFAGLAVPVRLFRSLNQKNVTIILIWFLALIISFYGLYVAKVGGMDSAGGLTVGLRIVLSLGVLLFPILIEADELYIQIKNIIRISIILFLFGLLNEHWLFVSISFPSIILFSNEKPVWKVLALLMTAILVVTGNTFTINLILIVSIFLVAYHKVKRDKQSGYILFRIKAIPLIAYSLFPLYIVFLTISEILLPLAKFIGSDKFLSKLFDDRGQLWTFTLYLINNSNFFIVPAARDIPVAGNGVLGESDWEAGAHNIFLEIARQNGGFVLLLLSLILFLFLWNLHKSLFFKYNLLMNTCLGFLAVYMVFGLTGNSLVYDGVGFLFWLIFSQIVKNAKNEYVYENSTSLSS